MKDIGNDIEIEVSKVTPKPGDVVIVKVRSDDVDTQVINKIRQHLKKTMPPNVDVVIYGLPSDEDDVDTICIGPDALKTAGYCPKCGRKGVWKSLALTCDVHGVFA